MKSWQIDGREFVNEYGTGASRVRGAIPLDLHDTHAHFCRLNMTQSGVVH